MRYFCSVKQISCFFRLAILCIITLACNEIQADDGGQTGGGADSITVSLLTCSPGDEVYSLYGHTAIRYTDYNNGVDVAVNYGVFSFGKPFFVLRFIFGVTDYEMGIVPFNYFCEEYRSEGRSVRQQELNLTPDEKLALRKALEENYLPQNRVYRYNYFYDNCTTRARDIIFSCINGRVEYDGGGDTYPSFRSLIHGFNENAPWARFGNDILLGVKADRKTDRKEHQFLPAYLMHDFDKARIVSANGAQRPLVTHSSTIVEGGAQVAEEGFPLRPAACAWIIFGIVVAVTAAEALAGRRLWPFDALLMTLYGCMGIVVFLMFFSLHPATSTNLQVLLFNPLPLVFAYRAARRAVKRRREPFWTYSAILAALFFIGGFFQDYAEGTYVLALSLLVRSLWNISLQNKYPSVNYDK